MFLRSALRDKLARREPASMTTGLLAMAIAELIWVVSADSFSIDGLSAAELYAPWNPGLIGRNSHLQVPCFIQCLLVFIEGRGGYGSWFSPPNEPGCQIQGWYSVMSSLSSMAGTAQMAYLTWRASCVSPTSITASYRVPTSVLSHARSVCLLSDYITGHLEKHHCRNPLSVRRDTAAHHAAGVGNW